MKATAQIVYPVLQHFAVPSPAPAPPGDVFLPQMSGPAPKNTPIIAEWTRTAGPDESVVLTGMNFSSYTGADRGRDSRFVVYGVNKLKDAKIQRLDSNKAMLTLDKSLTKSMFLLWPKNNNGYGLPIAINKTEAWWIGPDKATRGDTVSIYGRNLSRDGGTWAAYIYLKPAQNKGRWVAVTAVNPYKIDFKVPADLANGIYEVWAHNGHGGKWGWSGPLQLRVDSGWQWSSAMFNVKSFGAKGNGTTDDTQAILAACAAAGAAGNTVYFPAGVYSISNMLYLNSKTRWRGDGKTKTVLKCSAGFATTATSVVYANAVQAQIQDLSFDKGNLGVTNAIGKVLWFRGSTDVRLFNVGLAFAGFDVWDFHSGSHFYVKNCTVVASTAFLGNCSQLFIDKCEFKLTYDSDAMLVSWNGSQISITNSSCSDLNNANKDDGAGWGKGRFFVANGIWGSNRFTYLGQNTTTDLTVRLTGPDQNSGEQFLWEGNETIWSGPVVSAAATTTTLASFPGLHTADCYAVIVKGRGFGQWRRITGFANGTITLEEPWNLTPDKTSIINIGAYADKIVVYKNYLDAKPYAATHSTHIASAGIEPFGGVFNLVADNNTLNELRAGIANWALQNRLGIDPNYFNLYANNTFINCRWALFNVPSVTSTNGITALFGTVFRKNTIKNAVLSGVLNEVSADFPVLSTMVYEHNSFQGVGAGMESGTSGVDNQLLYSNSFVQDSTTASTPAIQVTSKPVLRQNRYKGFTTPYKDSAKSVAEAPYHVIELAGVAFRSVVDSSFVLWNSGATRVNWKASSSASWLTLGSASGSIQNESGSSVIKFKADAKGLASGIHSAILKITTAAQSSSYTIVFKLLDTAACSNTGAISWEYWANLDPSKPISGIPVDSTPAACGKVNLFAMPRNIANTFGVRLRGYICPPASGNYVFYIASDDYSELWLSTGNDVSAKQKIASVPNWTSPYDYAKFTSQQSKPIALQRGKRYYVEALYKDNYGGDHFSVGWQMPGGLVEWAISGAYLIPFTDTN